MKTHAERARECYFRMEAHLHSDTLIAQQEKDIQRLTTLLASVEAEARKDEREECAKQVSETVWELLRTQADRIAMKASDDVRSRADRAQAEDVK